MSAKSKNRDRFRKAVTPQIVKFKKTKLQEGPAFSHPENRPLADHEVTVDHAAPTFVEAMEKFLASRGLDADEPIGTKIFHRDIKVAWCEFHEQVALPGLRLVSDAFNNIRETPEGNKAFLAGFNTGKALEPLDYHCYPDAPLLHAAYCNGWECGCAWDAGYKMGHAWVAKRDIIYCDPLCQQFFDNGWDAGRIDRKGEK